ncbi:transcriptional regulator, LysR family [Thalassoporum mexicanum PCC 7367]|uniref:LysR family transcriptional regulator n=1 Tax=Thalassoporum mexicanum TaxID=3457544 RepID=UPI00029FCB15|nr:LysR family transcriptional regulator [Pseudanabaena sp. PCC 7367]AFY70604.1 transcriptional regulator, LysR family [Pseudanabaena sp. PCC 7367]
MRIEQLQAFLAVAEMGGFQQAAKKCGVTQSTISRQIQGLEASLGLPLLHRTAQAKLTIGGERLLPYARKICKSWDVAAEEISELLDGKQQELCIAAIHSVCTHYLPPALKQFCKSYPVVQLRVTALGSDRALKVLKDGLLDVAIVMQNRFLTNSSEMVMQPLFEEPIEVLLATDHPLARHRHSVTWAELAKYPHVVFKDGYGMQRLVQDQFAQRGLDLRMALELNAPDAFRGVIRQGEMVAILPRSDLLEAYQDPTLAVRKIETDPTTSNGQKTTLTRKIVMVTTSDRLQIPPIKFFFDLVCSTFTELRTLAHKSGELANATVNLDDLEANTKDLALLVN